MCRLATSSSQNVHRKLIYCGQRQCYLKPRHICTLVGAGYVSVIQRLEIIVWPEISGNLYMLYVPILTSVLTIIFGHFYVSFFHFRSC